MATITKMTATALNADRLLLTGGELTIDAARSLVGRTVEMPTRMANETAGYTIQSVSQDDRTGDIVAWMTREGKTGGRHAQIVAKS